MGLFSNKGQTLKFALGGYKFTIDDSWVKYQSAYGKSFKVPKKAIDTVSTDTAKGFGAKAKLKITGGGNTLAEVDLPKPWAEKAQEFILKECGLL